MSLAAHGTWLSRATQSRSFAWCVSAAVHALIFLGIYSMAVSEWSPARVDIIPEARLAPAPQSRLPAPASPPKLSDANALKPSLGEPARLRDLPVAAASPLAASEIVLPGELIGRAVLPVAPTGQTGMLPLVPTAPVSRLFGQAGNAYKVVYLVDLSESIALLHLDEVVRELQDSVCSLVPTQSFHVIAMPGRAILEFDPDVAAGGGAASRPRLVPATGRNKSAAMEFITVIEKVHQPGAADPVAAMERAFAVKPEMIYFLSDGDYANVAHELLARLRELNADRAVKITVIGFDPPKVEVPRQGEITPPVLLETIAREHGGHFRLVETP